MGGADPLVARAAPATVPVVLHHPLMRAHSVTTLHGVGVRPLRREATPAGKPSHAMRPARRYPIMLSTLTTCSAVPARTNSVSYDADPAASSPATNASRAEAFAASADSQSRTSPLALAVVRSRGTN